MDEWDERKRIRGGSFFNANSTRYYPSSNASSSNSTSRDRDRDGYGYGDDGEGTGSLTENVRHLNKLLESVSPGRASKGASSASARSSTPSLASRERARGSKHRSSGAQSVNLDSSLSDSDDGDHSYSAIRERKHRNKARVTDRKSAASSRSGDYGFGDSSDSDTGASRAKSSSSSSSSATTTGTDDPSASTAGAQKKEKSRNSASGWKIVQFTMRDKILIGLAIAIVLMRVGHEIYFPAMRRSATFIPEYSLQFQTHIIRAEPSSSSSSSGDKAGSITLPPFHYPLRRPPHPSALKARTLAESSAQAALLWAATVEAGAGSDGSWANTASSSSNALVIRDSGAQYWPALTHWTPQALIERHGNGAGHLNVLSSVVERFAAFDPRKPLSFALERLLLQNSSASGPETGAPAQSAHAVADELLLRSKPLALPAAEFFADRVTAAGGHSHGARFSFMLEDSPEAVFGENASLYFSLQDLQPPGVPGSLDPPFVRIITAGSALQPRFELNHAFHVQISGYALFTVFPSQFFIQQHLFPFLHPNYQHSQLPLGPDLRRAPAKGLPPLPLRRDFHSRFASATEAHGSQGLLTPGDVLYVPPYRLYTLTPTTPPSMPSAAGSSARKLPKAARAAGGEKSKYSFDPLDTPDGDHLSAESDEASDALAGAGTHPADPVVAPAPQLPPPSVSLVTTYSSPTGWEALARGLFTCELPFESILASDQELGTSIVFDWGRLIVVRLFVEQLIDRLLSTPGQSAAFIEALVKSRYAPHAGSYTSMTTLPVEPFRKQCRKLSHFHKLAPEKQLEFRQRQHEARVKRQLSGDAPGDGDGDDLGAIPLVSPPQKAAAGKSAASIAKLFQELPKATRMTLLMSFVEHAAERAVGAENVALFLSWCFK